MTLADFAPRPKHVLIGLAGAVVASSALLGIAYARTSIPSPSAIAEQQTTTIYYSDGKHVLARLGDTNRQDVSLSQVPVQVQHAVLAAEDRHFYSEPGVSPTGILRALAVDLRGGDISQGGSTITQQYVKNAYLSPQRSLTRKLKEILIATKLGQTRSKDAILEDYLNTIYFGRGAYGIEAASKAYFGHGVQSLTGSEGALLAAVIRGPSLYDPDLSAQTRVAAKQRWRYVIDGMVEQGWLSRARADRLSFPATKPERHAQRSQCRGTLCYIRDDVEYELTHSDGMSAAQLALGGYKIVTTINFKAEQALINSERNVVPYNPHGTPMSGAASIKPGDGAIEALYGGQKYCHRPKANKDACIDLSGFTGQWARPPGSSFKTFTLLAALRQGISLSSVYNGPSSIEVAGTTIHNSSPGESCYGCTLLTAFARSINTIFVPLAQQVGPRKVVQAAYDAGIPTTRSLPAVPDISLGPTDVSPVDLANAYATVAAGGVRASPYLVSSVTTSTGQKVYAANKHLVRTMSKSVAAQATYAMTKVLAPGGTAYGHALSGRPSAGKTGTTDNNTNAWFTGFTPQLSTSVWIGNVDPTQTVEGSGVGEVFGGTLPAEIWQQAMNAALAGDPVVSFPSLSSGAGGVQTSSSPTPTTSTTHSPGTSPTPTTSTSTSPTASASSTPTPTTSGSSEPSASSTATAHAVSSSRAGGG